MQYPMQIYCISMVWGIILNKIRILIFVAFLFIQSTAYGSWIESTTKVVFVGDSITKYPTNCCVENPYPVLTFTTLNSERPDITWNSVNLAVNGQTSTYWKNNWGTVVAQSGDVTILMIGVNDSYFHIAIATTISNLTYIITTQQSNNLPLILMKPTPVNNDPNRSNAEILAIGNAIDSLGKQYSVPVVDSWIEIYQYFGTEEYDDYFYDVVHISSLAHQAVADILSPCILSGDGLEWIPKGKATIGAGGSITLGSGGTATLQ